MRWRIYELKDQGVLRSIKRGRYTLNAKRVWKPEITKVLKDIYSSIRKEFPYLEFCIWSTQWLVQFSHHIPVTHAIIIETEKGTEGSVFQNIKNTNELNVLLKPSEKEIDAILID